MLSLVVVSALAMAACGGAAGPPPLAGDSTTVPPTEGSHLGHDASVSVPVGGLVVPEDRERLAREYGWYFPDGEYVGPVDIDGRPLVYEPIEGFGDFSATPHFLLDWQGINEAVVACMRANGFSLELHPDGLGADWSAVPAEQSQIAMAVHASCYAGLHVPDRMPFTDEQWGEILAYQTALIECVASFGYSVSDPPSLDEFIESDGNWGAYDLVPPMVGPAGDELSSACPQGPVGGFGAWSPGDPIRPYEG